MNKSAHKAHIGKVFHLGRYNCTVEDVIAEGGFAIVFRVRAQTGEIFALKRMYVNDEQDLKVCKREIQIVSSLTHKNIIRYIDSSITQLSDGVYEVLLLLEYCRRTVMQLLVERQHASAGLSEAEVMRIFCDVVEAVARLHHCTTPVMHRDLKVENILVDDRGSYVLCDFGSATAKVLEPDRIGAARCEEELTRYTTLAYRAPEMVDVYSGRPITTKADIWALGCMLYYLSFFQLPFGDSTLAIQSGRYTFPAFTSRAYSPALLSLIRYCLQIDPDRRPDIYQVAACAFATASRQNPIANMNHSTVLSLQELIAQYLDSEPTVSAQASGAKAKPPPADRDSRSSASANKSGGPGQQASGRPTDARPANPDAQASAATPTGSAIAGSAQVARPRPHANALTPVGSNPLIALPPQAVSLVSTGSNNPAVANNSTLVQVPRQLVCSNPGSTAGSSSSLAVAGTDANLPLQNRLIAGPVQQSHRRIASDSGNALQQQAQQIIGNHGRKASTGVSSPLASAPPATSSSAAASMNSLRVESASDQLQGLSFNDDFDFGAEFDKLRSQPRQQQPHPHLTHARTASQPMPSNPVLPVSAAVRAPVASGMQAYQHQLMGQPVVNNSAPFHGASLPPTSHAPSQNISQPARANGVPVFQYRL